MAIKIVDFPIKNGGSFHGKMLVHQRVIVMDDHYLVLKATVLESPHVMANLRYPAKEKKSCLVNVDNLIPKDNS